MIQPSEIERNLSAAFDATVHLGIAYSIEIRVFILTMGIVSAWIESTMYNKLQK